MISSIARWGNSQGVRIPVQILNTIPWYTKTEKGKIPVEVISENDEIIIRQKKDITIDFLFAAWSGEEYDSYDWGELDTPTGREMI